MGEAKRKNRQGQQFGQTLSQRITAGEFGPPGAARRYCIVLDKSVRGSTALAALRAGAGLEGVGELLGSDALRLWQASSLFRFAVLVGGSGSAERRSLLAADLDKLVSSVLPRALRLPAEPPGMVLAVDEDADAALQRALAQPPGRVS